MRGVTVAALLVGISALSFSLGKAHGLKTSPEYVTLWEREKAENEAYFAKLDAEYETSGKATCDLVFELVEQDLLKFAGKWPHER